MFSHIARFVALGLMTLSAANAQPARNPAASRPAAAVPVPRAAFIQTMDAEFGIMDADKNKIVTKAEIEQFQRAAALREAQARVRALFAQLDRDRNGQLSSAEFERLAIASPSPNAMPVLSQNDLNRDGKITLVEYRTAKLANFDRMDADKDGVVSITEMTTAGLIK